MSSEKSKPFAGYIKIRILRDSSAPYRAEYECHFIEGEWTWSVNKSDLPHRTLCGKEFPDMIWANRRTYDICPNCVRVRRRLERARRIIQNGPEGSRNQVPSPVSGPWRSS